MLKEFSSDWVRKTWNDANLGDKRRNRRVLQLANDLLLSPALSLPKATLSWKDLKAAYRLLNEEDVTHEALQSSHWAQVFDSAKNCSGPVLFIQDGSVLDYSTREATSGLGPIGNHEGTGINLHSCLAVSLELQSPSILGLAYQKTWIRSEKSKKAYEKRSDRLKRPTEADIWSDWIPTIDIENKKKMPWVLVGDRGNDIFKFLDICKKKGWDCLYRACQNRVVSIQGERRSLITWIRSLEPGATHEHILRSRDGKPARTIRLNISWKEITIHPPKIRGELKAAVTAWAMRCWNEEEKLEWILVTTLPILDSESAIQKTKWYAYRWIIEEYHKCLKTGCSIEQRRTQSAEGLMALTGILGIIATKLLELRSISREIEEKPAEQIVPEVFLHILKIKLKLGNVRLTIQMFWKQVARLGGFIGRRSDGDPGWQTLWAGWVRLLDMAWVLEKCG